MSVSLLPGAQKRKSQSTSLVEGALADVPAYTLRHNFWYIPSDTIFVYLLEIMLRYFQIMQSVSGIDYEE